MKFKALIAAGLFLISGISFGAHANESSWWVGGNGKLSLADNLDTLTHLQVTLKLTSSKKGVWLKNCLEGTTKLTPEFGKNKAICTVPEHSISGAEITNVDPQSNAQSWGSYTILN